MDLGLAGEAVGSVVLDGFSVFIRFADDSLLTIGCPYEISAPGRRAVTEDPEQSPEAERWQAMCGRRVRTAAVDEAGSELRVQFADGASVVVPSNPHYEAWTFNGSDGSLVVALPGGGLATWSGRTE